MPLAAFLYLPFEAQPSKIAQLDDPGNGVGGDPEVVIDDVWIHDVLPG
jgi:hypothetical protein